MLDLVGLTGGIGSGKSAATDRFAEHAITIVDADLASRAVVKPGKPALQAIAEHFGKDILQHDGTLKREELRHKIFAEAHERHWLQSLLHPLINEHLRDEIDHATSPYAILVNPLLIETRHYRWCDRILVIDVSVELQIERTMQRDGNSRTQVEKILNAQTSRDIRLSHAHDVIVNDGNLDCLHKAVDDLHKQYLKLAS